MVAGISSKIMKPHNCVLAFGIPTTEQDFHQDKLHPNKDFVKNCCGGWHKYYYEIVSNIEAIEPQLQAVGANIVHKLTLKDFGSLFREKQFDVVILFAHWKKEGGSEAEFIEFFDGLSNVFDVAKQIPQDFNGILDLSVCNPEKLALALRNQKVLIRYIPKKTTPYIWLYFYLVLFNLLNERDLTYLNALEMVITEVLEQDRRR